MHCFNKGTLAFVKILHISFYQKKPERIVMTTVVEINLKIHVFS